MPTATPTPTPTPQVVDQGSADGAHTSSRRALVTNNAVGLVLGSALMIFVHECGHWFMGAALGHRSVMYSYCVDQGDATGRDTALTALAGPVLSLVVGLVMSAWQPLRRRATFAHLLWVWFAFTSLMEFVTYLVITPFGAGDTATTLHALNLPVWLGFVACAIGICGMFWVARRFAPVLREIAGPDLARIRAVGFWAWLIGSVVNMANALLQMTVANMTLTAGEQIAILMAGMATSVFAPMAIGWAANADRPTLPMRLRDWPLVPILVTVAWIGFLVAIRGGIAIGG